MLSTDEIKEIHANLIGAETTFWLPPPFHDIVKLKHFTHVDDDGNIQPPKLFYDGVIYGVTAESSHDNEVMYETLYLRRRRFA